MKNAMNNNVKKTDLTIFDDIQDLPIDAHLKNLYNEAQEVFRQLDAASETIRRLETTLIELKAHFPFKNLIGEGPSSHSQVLTDKHKTVANAQSFFVKTCWYLSWEPLDEGSKNFRLFLIAEEKHIATCYFEDSYYDDEFDSRISFKKPFIETDLKTRIRYAEQVIPFVKAFTYYLADCRAGLALGLFPFSDK